MEKSKFRLKLRGKTAVFVDWANVYGWRGRKINPRKLYTYLKTYKEISEIRFYYGLDMHPKSKSFLKKMQSIGFRVVTKEVKYIPVSLDTSYFRHTTKEIKDSLLTIKGIHAKDLKKLLKILDRKIMRRKCDFDIEIAMDVYSFLDKMDTFIFFSGDGDFAPLMDFLTKKHKQVIVVFQEGHLGKEIARLGRTLFLCSIKNIPPIARGA